MIRGCMDTVEVEATAEGTTVLLDRRLRRDPVVGLARTAGGMILRQHPAEMGVTVTRSIRPSIAVSGPIDLSAPPRSCAGSCGRPAAAARCR